MQKNSNHELVSLKMFSFKLVIIWGGLKVRNLRLFLNKGVLVHLEDAFFFPLPCIDTGSNLQDNLPTEIPGEPHRSHSLSCLTKDLY